ncbi:MAG: hypothetical protein SNJ75_02360 [Gemmataceae bacterium]
MSPSVKPSEDWLRQIHQRICDRDVLAPQELCVALLRPLSDFLQRRFPAVDSHLCDSAATDAILEYLSRPHLFDPDRRSLIGYLRMIAQCDLHNLSRSEKRHKHVALPPEPGKGSPGGALESLIEAEQQQLARDQIAAIAERLSQRDRVVLQLMLDQERRTPVFATALGIEQLSQQTQKREVKRSKDRIKKRIRRGEDHV